MSPRGPAVPATCVSLGAAVPAGILATITMDGAMAAAMLIGGRSFATERLGIGMIGRWAAGLARGRLRMPDVSREPAVRGEAGLGLLTHYATGVTLTEVYVLLCSATGRGGIGVATIYGAATSVLPLFVMFPSMGYGVFGRRSGEAPRLLRVMAVGHVAFGAGIGFWSRALLPRPAEVRRP